MFPSRCNCMHWTVSPLCESGCGLLMRFHTLQSLRSSFPMALRSVACVFSEDSAATMSSSAYSCTCKSTLSAGRKHYDAASVESTLSSSAVCRLELELDVSVVLENAATSVCLRARLHLQSQLQSRSPASFVFACQKSILYTRTHIHTHTRLPE